MGADPITLSLIAGSMLASTVASQQQAKRQAEAQAQAQKEAMLAQQQAQKEATAQAQALDRQQSIDKLTSESASTDYGVDKKTKVMTSNDLIVPSAFEQSLGTSSKKTGLGF